MQPTARVIVNALRLMPDVGRTMKDGATRAGFMSEPQSASVRSHAILFVGPDRHADSPTQAGALPTRPVSREGCP